ncbi:MAG: tetratricopeptide repeat protein, partial [Arenimonas sp.]
AGLCGSLGVLMWYVPAEEHPQVPRYMQEAEAACARALELAPDLADAHTMAAKLYTAQWQWARAKPHYERALALSPDDAEVHFNYSDWLAATGRTDEALGAIRRAIALDPLVPIFLSQYGFLLNHTGRPHDAVMQFEAAYALTPDVPLISRNLFQIYYQVGRIDDAEKLLDATRAGEAARAKRLGIDRDVQATRRLAIRIAREPGQRDALISRLDAAARDEIIYALPQGTDELFGFVKARFDRNVTGPDEVILLRISPQFAALRGDPRYKQLLVQAGFDENGAVPAKAAPP